MRARKKPSHPESDFQIAVVRFLRYFGFLVYSVPNGTKLKLSQAVTAKREGLLAGVSDLVVLMPGAQSLYVEMKKPSGLWTQSEEQKKFQRAVESMGFTYVIWDRWDLVEKFVNENRGKRCPVSM